MSTEPGDPRSPLASARGGVTWPDVLTTLVNGRHLTSAMAHWAMSEILSGNATSAQIAGFAVALRAKGETVDEISGLANAMLDTAIPIQLERESVDVVGSGGDRANTVNVSTMAAIVAAGAGARVVKHGNRSASSMCGTADCLEALGLNLAVDPSRQPEILAECSIVFLFAPLYHRALRHTAAPRKELGIQTTFNFLGPLANAARPRAQAIGVANHDLAGLIAGVLAQRGDRGVVFRGLDGLDELTTTRESEVWVVRDGDIHETRINPAKLGIPRCQLDDLVGGDPAHNAQVVRRLLDGEHGPVRDIVLLNTAATLVAFDGPALDRSLDDQLVDALGRAEYAVDSGEAAKTLQRWVAASNRT